jgi:hypothetical protein
MYKKGVFVTQIPKGFASKITVKKKHRSENFLHRDFFFTVTLNTVNANTVKMDFEHEIFFKVQLSSHNAQPENFFTVTPPHLPQSKNFHNCDRKAGL